MDPYNVSKIPDRKIITVTYANGTTKLLSNIKIDNNFFFPQSIIGSFKYFYFRFPEFEKKVVEKYCLYLSKNQVSQARLIKIETIGKEKAFSKEFSCLN